MVNNGLARRAVAKRIRPRRTSQKLVQSCKNLGHIAVRYPYGANVHSFGPLGGRPQHDARCLEHASFFLNAAGVRQHNGRGPHQAQGLEIAERRPNLPRLQNAAIAWFQTTLGARVDWKYDRQAAFTANGINRLQDFPACVRIVYVGWSVERDQRKTTWLNVKAVKPTISLKPVHYVNQRIHYGVAGYDNTIAGDSLTRQIRRRGLRWGVEPVGQVVDHNAIELLGHRPIAAAQTRLNVADRNRALGRPQGAGQS